MPSPLRNPDSPDFPHGQPHGYASGCRATYACPATPTCIQIHRARVAERKREGAGGYSDVAAVQQRIRELLQEGWTLSSISRAAGLNKNTALNVMKSRSCHKRTAVRILAVTRADLRAVADHIPVPLVRWKLGSLHAAGFSIRQMAAKLGWSEDAVSHVITGACTRVDSFRADDIDLLFQMWEDARPTGPIATWARSRAKQMGFYPPDYYTEDGQLMDLRPRDALAEEVGRRLEDRAQVATTILKVLRLTLRFRMNAEQIARSADIDPTQVSRIRSAAGLQFIRVKTFEPGATRSVLADTPLNHDRVRKILAVLDQWERDTTLDPFLLVREELGMLKSRQYNLNQRRLKKAA
ncbi:hypothetical protein ACFFMN_23645 [Planobispora siamensis]|uniref:Uncharacterized protein n=1 Tax=Planobispora siamensis TaxID=936338 RepID=A0A8J3WLJ3_9ACTN|nr:hypothetical protein [Planobispora siamensis]GIH95359.1 hypothetical protein Psi01_59890 [Planobispora siamensis]